MRESLRKSGIDIIGDVPWGTHFCQFYQTKKDLVDILVPYFKAGLENNELCVWITSQPIEVEEAKEAMKRAVPDIDVYLEKGQMEIIPYTQGYMKEGIFDPDKVVNSWVEKIDQVLATGYDGLRASGDNRWLEKEGWDDFVDYEKKVDAFIDKNLVIALCPYYLDMCSTAAIIDVISNHQFALIKRGEKWERIENSGRKRAEKEAIQAAKNWKYTFDAVPDLVAIIDDECRIVRANRAMTARLGVKPEECVGLTCYRVIHGTDKPPSFCPHRQLLEDGAEHTTEVCEDCLGGYFAVSTTPLHDSEGKLIGSVYVARDINERKKVEERLKESEEKYRNIVETANEGILRIDAEVRITYANKKITEMLGYGLEELIGRFLWDFADEEGKAILKLNMEKRRQGINEVYELKLICKDGSPLWALISAKAFFNKEGEFTGSLGMFTDITKRKQTEEGLLQSEQHYRLLYETMLQGVVYQDASGRIISMNPAAERILGKTPAEFLGSSSVGEEYLTIRENGSIFPGLEHPAMVSLRTGREVQDVVMGVYNPRENCYRWININAMPIFRTGEDKPFQVYTLFDDITESKQEEHRIRRYNRILEGINRIFSNVVQAKTEEELGNACLSVALEVTGSQFGFINEMGADGLLHDVAKSELGWEQCFMYDKTGHRRPPSDFVVHGLYGSVIINEKSFFTNDPQSHPESIGLPEGHPPLMSFLGVPLVQDGKTIGLIAVANHEGGYSCEQQEDLEAIAPAVTQALQRRRSEEALRVSNIYNRSLIETSLDPLVTIGHDGKITDVNVATEQVTGYSRNDLIGTDFSDYFTEPEKARKGYQQVFTNGEVRDYPLEIRHKDEHITPVLYNASVYRNENDDIIGVFAAARDITELKNAEEKIQILANAVESSEDAIITKSLDGTITSWNKGAEKIYGYSAGEVLGKDISILEPDYLKGEIKFFSEKIKQGEKVQHYETLRLKKDGTLINISVTLSPVFNASGELAAISTIARDITERKKAEEALRLSNIYNRSLIEASLDPLVTIGPDGKITDVNGATELITGYSRNDLIGTDFSDYFTEPEKARKGYQQVFTDGEVRDYPLEIKHKDEHITPVLYHAAVYKDENDEVIGVFAAARDITERKKAEEALKKAHDNLEEKVKARTSELEEAYNSLKESERGLAEAQKMAHIGNWDWDLVTGETYWSEEIYRIYGRNPQESGATYDELLNYIHPDDREYVDNAIKKSFKGKPSGIDYRIVLANGEERTVHAESEVIFDENNIPIRAKGIIQDITESKRAEEKIQTLANAVESSNDAIVTESLEGIITSWNQGAEQVYGYSAEEILGKNISIIEPANLKEEIKQSVEKTKQGERVQNYETSRLKKDGTIINVSITFSPIFDSSGKLVAISTIARDITERIKAEEALAKIEDARKKEIHHRIKNNLQVISSLLDLQAEKFRDKEVLEAFRESQNRVVSMALIHEELYKGEGTDTLDFSAYIQKLAENLFQTYSLSSRNIRLLMDLEENAFFDMDIAVPLGIIVNELISNSLKHAFTEDEEGEIRIKLCRKEKNNEMHKSLFSLTISDNGKGISQNIELESLESLGLQLVNTLVDQLDGKIELKRTHGTEFRITFNVKERS